MNTTIKLAFVAAAFVAAGAMESQDMEHNKNDAKAYQLDTRKLEEIERLEQSLKDAPEHERKYILAAIEGLKR